MGFDTNENGQESITEFFLLVHRRTGVQNSKAVDEELENRIFKWTEKETGSLFSLLRKKTERSSRRIAFQERLEEGYSYGGNEYVIKQVKFHGRLTICNLQGLQFLALGSNSLTAGLLPSSIFNISSLELIHLGNSGLFGSLPTDICNHLPALRHLRLSRNMISGTIPKNINNCTSLEFLCLDENRLTGEIPDEIGNLQSLRDLALGSNGLTGIIPASIFNISTIEKIYLSLNNLSGCLPSSFGQWLPNLVRLTIGHNKLTGTIPNSISNASKLTFVSLDGNSFSGLFPNTFGNLRLLKLLSLAGNNLTTESPTTEWSFLSSLTNCRELEILYLDSNPWYGVLPLSIGNISANLQYFGARNCKIKGSIPVEIGNLHSLLVLDLSMNDFNGYMPTTVGRLPNLQRLNLRNNNLLGSIPYELCILENFYELYLSANDLSRRIQPCLVRLISLRYLYLDSNRLTSDIPSALWSLKDILEVNLSSNSLSGSFSSDLQNLHVRVLDLSKNQLSGNILVTLGHIATLETLSLADNKFDGPIPTTFGILISLVSLDLSNNSLSEYGSMGIASTRGDVYSFGVLLMETFTRKKPTDEMLVGEMSLKNLVESSLPHAVTEVVDANLLRDQNPFDAKVNCMLSIMDLALNCSMESLEQRISMKDALAKLKKIKLQFHKDVGAPN
ncbi:probable LRR receptor-like serine/threonine-protein kinase At3g47570 [Pistacia vera]|uniref:probable LRR receptor-like serine/threonine-protein kinase At3g47570 n=1 Tax=Pistacia vera TaxID=55513 RepID=UPI0012632B84|nr:probable LRR receptor-like serine/threonine-protein kinase At3g47570 [Pistacia vera]